MILNLKTNKQEGDIAGSKLVKFYRHLAEEIGKSYKIVNKGFEYGGQKNAEAFFVVKNKGGIIFNGPSSKDKENTRKFKMRHKNTFVKNGKIYAREKINQKIGDFSKEWKSKNSEKIREMGISRLEIVRD